MRAANSAPKIALSTYISSPVAAQTISGTSMTSKTITPRPQLTPWGLSLNTSRNQAVTGAHVSRNSACSIAAAVAMTFPRGPCSSACPLDPCRLSFSIAPPLAGTRSPTDCSWPASAPSPEMVAVAGVARVAVALWLACFWFWYQR